MRPRVLHFLVLLGLLTAASSLAGEPPQPTPAALKLVEGLRATRMGVDRFGNLWSWNQNSGAVQAISSAGSLVSASRVGSAAAVDFDAQWGWAWLERYGRRLFLKPLAGDRPEVDLPLEERMADVVWIGENRVALSTATAAYRVEIWDVAAQRRIATWGKEQQIQVRSGTVRLNHFLLKYDFEEGLLYTLDTFAGRIEVFDPQGRLVRKHQVAGRDQASLEKWLRETDQENREKGRAQEVTVSQWAGFVVDSEGGIWLHEECVPSDDTEMLKRLKLPAGSQLERHTLTLDSSQCCALTSSLWGDWLILYRDPMNPKGACVHSINTGNEP